MSRAPRSTVPDHRVEDCEQLPHARYQGYLLGLARLQEPLVELLDGGVVASGDQSSHVEGCPQYRCPPTPHLPLAAALPGIVVEGSHSHQGTHRRLWVIWSPVRATQQEQRASEQHRSHAGNASQERLVVLEGAARGDRLLEIPIGAGELLLEPADVGSDAPGDRLLKTAKASPSGIRQMSRRSLETSIPTWRTGFVLVFMRLMLLLPVRVARPCGYGLASCASGPGNRSGSTRSLEGGRDDPCFLAVSLKDQGGTGLSRPRRGTPSDHTGDPGG